MSDDPLSEVQKAGRALKVVQNLNNLTVSAQFTGEDIKDVEDGETGSGDEEDGDESEGDEYDGESEVESNYGDEDIISIEDEIDTAKMADFDEIMNQADVKVEDEVKTEDDDVKIEGEERLVMDESLVVKSENDKENKQSTIVKIQKSVKKVKKTEASTITEAKGSGDVPRTSAKSRKRTRSGSQKEQKAQSSSSGTFAVSEITEPTHPSVDTTEHSGTNKHFLYYAKLLCN